MVKTTEVSGESPAVDDIEHQRVLKQMILRGIVEGDGFDLTSESRKAVSELREICKRRSQNDDGKPKEAIAIAFATAVITAAVAAIVAGFKYLLEPPEGSATIYNPGPPIKVWTYDEGDAVRWIAYHEYSIGTNEAVPLTARGKNAVQIVVLGKPAVHTCGKGQSYMYDGSVMQPRIA